MRKRERMPVLGTLHSVAREVVRGAVGITTGVLCAAHWAVRGSLHESLEGHAMRWTPMRLLIGQFPTWSHDIWTSHEDEACAIVLWIAFAVLLVSAKRPVNDASTRAAYALFGCAALTYVLLPYSVGVGVMLNVRVAVFVSLFAPLLIEPNDRVIGKLARATATGAAIILAGSFIVHARTVEDEEVGDIERLFSHVKPGAKILTLPFHLTSRHTHWAPWTFVGSYARAEKGGVSSYSFSSLNHWPLHYRAEEAPPAKPLFWTFDACRFRNAYDGPYYDYVLTRGNVDPFRDAPPGPRWVKIDATRDITLYARADAEPNGRTPDGAWPAWDVPDLGPCESRRSLESANRASDPTH